jgi:pSer/pThr/pTyr-binding forkhead associated (FHA) protein
VLVTAGDEYEVSRIHARLAYNKALQVGEIMDFGSANGTYINDALLHPAEVRVLRNNDELKLGRLTFRVQFRRP